jgi:hypothetical protein
MRPKINPQLRDGVSAGDAKQNATRYIDRHGGTVNQVENASTIQQRIIELKQEHRDLDLAIDALVALPVHDELQLRRLKKRKLLLKDQVAFLNSQLTPDILA